MSECKHERKFAQAFTYSCQDCGYITTRDGEPLGNIPVETFEKAMIEHMKMRAMITEDCEGNPFSLDWLDVSHRVLKEIREFFEFRDQTQKVLDILVQASNKCEDCSGPETEQPYDLNTNQTEKQ